jgi:hypothetical protein
LVSVVVLLFFGCTKAENEYFPKRIFRDKTVRDESISKWYGGQLSALEESSIWAQRGTKKEIYRFTWLRTFHNPIAVRLEMSDDGTGVLFLKRCDGAGGYKPGKLILNKSAIISKEEMDNVKKKFDKLNFWEQSSRDPGEGGMDGAQWIFEGLRDGKYHLVDRWTPEKGPIYEIGLEFQKLAGVTEKKEDIY